MGCLKLTYQKVESSPLKVVHRSSDVKQKSEQRFLSVDPLADQFAAYSPYLYTLGNPLKYTDPTGMAPESPDWEWRVNSKTGEKEIIGDKGGADKQYIYWDNDIAHSDVLQGSEVHVGPVATDWYSGDIEFAVSSVDLWSDIPDNYLGSYTKFDLADRYNAMQKGDPNGIARQEAACMDRCDMIWNRRDYGRYLDNTYGSRDGLTMLFDNKLIRTTLGFGTGKGLNKALNFLKKAPQTPSSFAPKFKPQVTPKLSSRPGGGNSHQRRKWRRAQERAANGG